jgi:Cft2 family RNA processing exonuclease
MDPIYTKKDIYNELRHIITVDYGEVVDITPEIKMTLYNSGHILGSASVHLHIGEGAHNLVYTADQKFGFTKLFDPANTKFPRLETLLIESTYGGRNDRGISRFECEKKLTTLIHEVINRKGKVLIPVFAVGRSQEIMLVLEDYARRNPDFNAPIYIDGMVLEASAIHTAYPEFLREQLQRRILSDRSPFESPMIKVAKGTNKEEIVNGEPAVILAPSGMLNGGPSVEYLKMMADDPKNLLTFVGYQSALSLGSKIQRGQREIPIIGDDGKTKMLDIKMQVETAEGFSVPYDTEIMIKRDGEFGLIEIGKIADEYLSKEESGNAEIKGIEVPSFDSKGNIEWKKASHVIKHKRKEKHIKIKTKSGREIQVSKGHSLFTLKDMEVKTITGGELKENDYIAIPNQLPQSHSIHSIDFSEDKVCNDMNTIAGLLGNYIAERIINNENEHFKQLLNHGIRENEILQFIEKIKTNERLPNIIFNFDQNTQKEFLKVFFRENGNFRKNTNKKLVSDLSYLSLQHGIFSGISGLPIKETGIENWYKKIKDPNLRKLAEDYTHTVKKGREHIGITVLKKLIKDLDPKELKDLRIFTEGHLALDQIVSIEEGDDGEFEYDISVPGTENFVGGIGGIMLHNSGHSDRAQLMAYLKNLRPTPERIITMHGDWGKTEDFARSAGMMLRKEGRALDNLEAVRLR